MILSDITKDIIFDIVYDIEQQNKKRKGVLLCLTKKLLLLYC